MERLTMRYLLLSSALLSIAACSLTKHNISSGRKEVCPAITRRQISTATYNTQIDLFGKHFSGLTVFKATSDTSERAIFITEVGFKFFDFEFTPAGFSIKYSVPGPGKKIIVKILKRDLGYLSRSRNPQIVSATKTDSCVIYRCKAPHGKFDYYSINSAGTTVKKIEYGTAIHKSLVIDFDGIKNGNFDTIKINDHSAYLKIFMKQIDK